MSHTSYTIRIVLLALAAAALGVAVLAVDQMRRSETRSVARLPTAAAAPAPAMRVSAPAASSLVASAAPISARAPSPAPAPASRSAIARRGGVACESPHQLVDIPSDRTVFDAPAGRVVGVVPSRSVYLGEAMKAWVQTTTPDGAWGKVTIPWTKNVTRTGWISLRGLARSETRIMVVGSLGDRMLRVYRGCTLQLEAPAAVGAPGSPSPTGRFWVTDRVSVPRSQPYFGSYAFGMSTIQPSPPRGWTGGNQMAIHGTNTPATIGTRASAGCLRVAEPTLDRLRAMVGLGTPVVITR